MVRQLVITVDEDLYETLCSLGTEETLGDVIEGLLKPYTDFDRKTKSLEDRKKLSKPQSTLHLSVRESELFQMINAAFPETERSEYQQLVTKRQSECLTEPDYDRLLELSDRLEQLQADRLTALVELSQLQQVSLQDLMQRLDLGFIVNNLTIDG